ncbi:MAG: acyltransferase family protein, partial [Actinobacteria bacterium]|nr:acyltransferase family protein [Actinomycetota bacterium]
MSIVDPHPEATRAAWEPLGRVPALDGLRAVAVLAVFLYHGVWFGIEGGFIGVDLFFTLSGFLITRLLVDEFVRDDRISLHSFFIRRSLRLLPALFAMVGSVAVLAWLLDAPALEDRITSRSLWALSYVANWRDVITRTHSGPFSHIWSLSVEEQFYVIWPLVTVALIRWRGPAAVARFAGGLALILASITALRYRLGTPGMVLFFSTDSHGAILLLSGSWLGASPQVLRRLRPELGRVVLAIGLVGFVVFSLAPDRYNVIHLGFGYTPIALVSLLAIAGAVACPDTRILTWEPLAQIGRSSYAIYLWHIPMFAITGVLAPGF